MDRFHVRKGLLKIAMVSLLISTWVFSSFIFATRPEQSGANTLTSLVRLPASLPSQLPQLTELSPRLRQNLKGVFTKPRPPVEAVSMDVMSVPCWDKLNARIPPTSAHWVRLIGKTCQGTSDPNAITVRNLTNGYTATVFPTHGDHLTTDFVPLANGKNEILIRFQSEPGAVVESQIAVVRE